MKIIKFIYISFLTLLLMLISMYTQCFASDLSIESEVRINGVNVSERGIRIIDNSCMECTFSFTNTGETNESVIVLLSTYTLDGKLYTVKIYKADIEVNQTTHLEFSYEFDAEKENNGKLMVWNSLSKIMPLKASVDFSQNSGVNTYYYDENNRLIQVDKSNGASLIFTYDNMGNVISKTIRK